MSRYQETKHRKRQAAPVFLHFLADRKLVIIMFLAFCGIFACVFHLYGEKTEPVLYAALLCLILTLAVLAPGFYHYKNKHHELSALMENISYMTDNLSPPDTYIESEYQNLISQLGKINHQNLADYHSQRTELIEYYTTWVHQIKTPIAAMRLLLSEDDTPQNRQLQSELFKIEQYVEMVLCYFRVDSHSSDFVLKEHSLDNIIRQAIRKYASQFVQKKIGLSYTPVEQIVLTDEKWLLFVIEQILSNAIKYTAKGQITISADENQILCIEDTGIGIAAEDLPRIFEKGYTGYNGHDDKKSTGIGLYLCQKITNKLSHRMWAESTPGQGSRFYIDLSHREFFMK